MLTAHGLLQQCVPAPLGFVFAEVLLHYKQGRQTCGLVCVEIPRLFNLSFIKV